MATPTDRCRWRATRSVLTAPRAAPRTPPPRSRHLKRCRRTNPTSEDQPHDRNTSIDVTPRSCMRRRGTSPSQSCLSSVSAATRGLPGPSPSTSAATGSADVRPPLRIADAPASPLVLVLLPLLSALPHRPRRRAAPRGIMNPSSGGPEMVTNRTTPIRPDDHSAASSTATPSAKPVTKPRAAPRGGRTAGQARRAPRGGVPAAVLVEPAADRPGRGDQRDGHGLVRLRARLRRHRVGRSGARLGHLRLGRLAVPRRAAGGRSRTASPG